MSEELRAILTTLEKPLTFISRNNFSNINKVKSLSGLVDDLTLKALSLPLSRDSIKVLESLKRSFSIYDELSDADKKELIKKALHDVRVMIRNVVQEESKETQPPERPQEKELHDTAKTSEHMSYKAVPEGDDLSEISIQYIKGVGPRIASVLKKKGIESVENALYYFPRKYEDRTTVKSMSKLIAGERETFMGEIVVSGRIRTRRGAMYQVVVSDGTGMVTLVWFKFSEKYLRAAYKKGASVILTGEVSFGYRDALQIVHPRPEDIEVIDNGEDIDHDSVHFNRIVPIYPLTEGIGQRRMRSIMKSVVDTYCPLLKSFLPQYIKKERGLLGFESAVERVHFPAQGDRVVDIADTDSVYHSLPHKTLAYSEFFLTELGLALKKRDVARLQGIAFSPTGEFTSKLLSRLTFDLTGAQQRAVAEIENDMRSERPMNRLLQGDVGSGKTIVAVLSILKAVECGY